MPSSLRSLPGASAEVGAPRPIPPVALSADPALGVLQSTVRAAQNCVEDPSAALEVAVALGTELPSHVGAICRRWEVLASLGAVDLTAARAIEPHLDALAILDELGTAERGASRRVLQSVDADVTSTWGVWAAESPGTRLEARSTSDGWTLEGVKPWCSLADRLSHALVTACLPDGRRRLFAVALAGDDAEPEGSLWVARGLRRLTTGSVRFRRAHAEPVGEPEWYLERPGFAWGGIGVAACWYGATVGLARRLLRQGEERRLDQVGQLHLGAVDVGLHAARTALSHAAQCVDSGAAGGQHGAALALRTRAVVRQVADDVLTRVAHATGPAPLSVEEDHARRVADLTVYLRQEHADRDLARLGARLESGPSLPSWEVTS